METIIETASKEIGTPSDINGSVNPRVLEYFAKIGATYEPGYDEVWCAAFVGFILEICGIHSTRALNARSYLNWGVSTKTPKQGDVVVFWRDSVSSSNGHVSFFHHEDENTVYCLGGNQLGGVVSIEGYPKSRVLDYRSAITTNAPREQTNNHMEPETTPTTPKTVIVKKITVTFDEVDSNGTVLTTDNTEPVTVTPELVAALKLEDAALVEGAYNVTVVAA